MSLYKTCSKCTKTKCILEYHFQKGGMYGRNSVCKECRKIKGKITFIDATELKCNKCKEIKPCNNFYSSKTVRRGYQSYCKVCQRLLLQTSKNKLENFSKLILKKFKKKFKNHDVQISSQNVIEKYHEQEFKCAITNHRMTHCVDDKMRTDNVWNLAIHVENPKETITTDDFCLVTNFCYSSFNLHSFTKKELIELYDRLTEKQSVPIIV